MARLAARAGVKEGEVVRVPGHFADMGLGVYDARVGEGGEVEEEVRAKDGDGTEEFVGEGEVRPGDG